MRTVVCFQAGQQRYAVAVEAVVEVRPFAELASMPGAQAGVIGMLEHRDGPGLFPVLNTLGAGSVHLLVLRDGDVVFALATDGVVGLVRLTPNQISDPPAGQVGWIQHACRVGEDRFLLVDPARLGEAALAS